MERMACPECETVNPMVAVVDGIRRYICLKCGMVYYTPDDCLREDKKEEKK